MQIVKLKLSELAPNTGQIPGLPINPRQWTKGDVDKIAASLKETPELFEARPVLVIPHDGKYVILGGNLRYEGARANKEKEVPAIIFPEDTPVEKLKEVVIKDNGAFGAWDYDALANEWDDLPLGDWGVPAWSKEEEKSLDGISDEVKEDEFDEDVETRCQPGDIWQLGNHRLMCGDSTDAASVALLMNGEKADIVFTSPPYNGDNSMPQQSMKKGNVVTSQKLYNKGYADDLTSDEYVRFCKRVLDICFDNTDGFIFWNVNYNANSRFEYISQIQDKLPYLIEQICWKKQSSIPFKGSMKRIWEPIYLFSTNGKKLSLKECVENLWEISNFSANNADHNACYPVALVAQGIKLVEKAERILDPFGGTGTIIIAAEQLGRKCFMMELDPHYCDVILARWEKLTGQTATKL